MAASTPAHCLRGHLRDVWAPKPDAAGWERQGWLRPPALEAGERGGQAYGGCHQQLASSFAAAELLADQWKPQVLSCSRGGKHGGRRSCADPRIGMCPPPVPPVLTAAACACAAVQHAPYMHTVGLGSHTLAAAAGGKSPSLPGLLPWPALHHAPCTLPAGAQHC
jgi:hypothetical protein